jgi:hypothetical protein
MTKSVIELDKTWTASVGQADSYGSVTIRVVVVPPKEDKEGESVSQETEEPLMDLGSGPLDSYLERPRGEGYVVFLVQGQRHDSLDESFVQRELGFKYLRTRTMIIIDVDGLAPDATAELIQGSRQGMYQGKVYYAILDRVISVLKKDPDLSRLELYAEQKIAELKTGDESIRRKLDQLIEGHHSAGEQGLLGQGTKGGQAGPEGQATGESSEREVVINAKPSVGEPALAPVLVADPQSELLRLYPCEEKVLTIRAEPASDWSKIGAQQMKLVPAVPELEMVLNKESDSSKLTLKFNAPDDMQIEDYPIKAKLTFLAPFDGSHELRLLEKNVVVAPRGVRPTPPPPVLNAVPTFLKVSSRQPVKLVPGGPSTHVRLKWDGEDHLASGWPPACSFSARCLSLESFPTPIFSKPRAGNLELLLDTPHGLLSGQQLEFQVEVAGPNGTRLVTVFTGQVTDPLPEPEPRKKKEDVPSGAQERRRPYELKVIEEPQWDSPCWDAARWTKHDAGCFEEATATTPLTLIINQDAAVLKTAREQMLTKQLDEATIQERLGRYTAHVCFHLYNMYTYVQDMEQAKEADETVRVPNPDELRAEINRVALTLAALMDR